MLPRSWTCSNPAGSIHIRLPSSSPVMPSWPGSGRGFWQYWQCALSWGVYSVGSS